MNITMKRVVLIISVALMFVMISASSYAATVTYSASAMADQGLTGTRTLKGLATSIGSSKQATIVLSHTSSGNTTTYSMSQSVTLTSNITLKIEKGAVLSIAVGKTLTMNGTLDAGEYQIFSGAGTVTYTGKKYPEWWGAKDDSGTTDNTSAINAALAAGGEVELTAPNGGYYKITDTLTTAVAGTKLYSKSKAEIKQATASKGGVAITASNVEIQGIKLTGTQYVAGYSNEKAIYAYGANASNYISNIKVIDCEINTWGMYAILASFVENFDFSNNKIDDIYYAAILGLSVQYGSAINNKINNIVGKPNAYGIEWTRVVDDSLVTYPRSKDILTANNVVRNVLNWKAYGTHGGERLVFSDNDAYGCYIGYGVGAATGTSVDATFAPLAVTISGGTLDSGVTDGTKGFGIFFAGAIDVQLATGSISGVTIKGYGDEDSSTGTALYVHSTEGLSISGLSILSPGRTGVLFEGLNIGASFTGSTIYDAWSETYAPIGVYVNGGTGTIDGTTYNSSVTIDGITFSKGTSSATYTYASTNAAAIRVNSIAGNYVNLGKNYINNVHTYLLDTGFYATSRKLTSASTSGTGEDNLDSMTIPAATIGVSGGLRITAAGTKAGANGNKTLKFYFGATAVTFHAAANNTNDWRFEAVIFNKGTNNAQAISWIGHDGATALQGYDNAAIDTTDAVTVKITGECADGGDTIISRMFFIERL